MGSFTQDFQFSPETITEQGLDISTEDGLLITTELGDDIATDIVELSRTYLDANNGRVCNTPEYPVELYPDGVYCYFTTTDDNNLPTYPYIIGKNYQNLAIEWYINWTTQPYPEKIRYGSVPYSTTRNVNVDVL